ncbi:hypothetical protein PL9214650656 [Planktothrix tepida PCC 9214]|uniref:Uncharacterized protein n=1 Tax=Planktothrix tepida PCC 9214 TaxID=671072 RepID=A0A1J1LUI2_9CYAN|nr:hypothetical protein PL9214650656 [Planktothrix tepida PCC 9214]
MSLFFQSTEQNLYLWKSTLIPEILALNQSFNQSEHRIKSFQVGVSGQIYSEKETEQLLGNRPENSIGMKSRINGVIIE